MGIVGGRASKRSVTFSSNPLTKVEPQSVCFSGWLATSDGAPDETALNTTVPLNVTAADDVRLARDVLRRWTSAALADKKKKRLTAASCYCKHVVNRRQRGAWNMAGIWDKLFYQSVCEKQKNKLFFFKPGQLYAVAAGRGSMLSPLYWSQCSVSCLHKWLISQSHCTHKRLHFRHADAVRTTSWRSKQASECGTKKKDSSDFEHGLVVGVGCNNILKQPLITTEVCRVATPSTLTQYTWTFTGPFK